MSPCVGLLQSWSSCCQAPCTYSLRLSSCVIFALLLRRCVCFVVDLVRASSSDNSPCDSQQYGFTHSPLSPPPPPPPFLRPPPSPIPRFASKDGGRPSAWVAPTRRPPAGWLRPRPRSTQKLRPPITCKTNVAELRKRKNQKLWQCGTVTFQITWRQRNEEHRRFDLV